MCFSCPKDCCEMFQNVGWSGLNPESVLSHSCSTEMGSGEFEGLVYTLSSFSPSMNNFGGVARLIILLFGRAVATRRCTWFIHVKWRSRECQDPRFPKEIYCIVTRWSMLFTSPVSGFKGVADRTMLSLSSLSLHPLHCALLRQLWEEKSVVFFCDGCFPVCFYVRRVLKYSQGTEVLQSWGERTEAQRCHSGWPPGRWTEQCCRPAGNERMMVWQRVKHRQRKKEGKCVLTLSVRVASQPGTDSSWRTMSTWPCSQAHMSAVEPSSSRMLTCAPQDSSARTMSPRPWLTASISAVWPAYKHTDPISEIKLIQHLDCICLHCCSSHLLTNSSVSSGVSKCNSSVGESLMGLIVVWSCSTTKEQ